MITSEKVSELLKKAKLAGIDSVVLDIEIDMSTGGIYVPNRMQLIGPGYGSKNSIKLSKLNK